MTLAAALTVTSCLKEVEGGSAAYDDGTLVDATFSVTLGPQTKAFATGSTANQLYAGLYEKKGETAYAYVADTKVAVSEMKGTITFEKGLQRGKSYKVVFWAQHEADGFTSPYTVKLDTATPSVTVATSGAANDDNRDAFYKVIEFGPVKGDVAYDEGDIILKRPFAQVNVIVPNENIDVTPASEKKSSMTVTGAPNVLNLLTGTASGEVAYSFTEATIRETDVFGSYTEHQYLAMNYVLVDQTGAGSYPVTFSVTSDAQVASNKTVNVPLKPNVRTNIVGNVFQDNFNFSGVAVVTPGTEEGDETLEIRTVTIKVDGSEPGDSEHVAVGGTSVLTLTFDGNVTGSISAESSNPNVATVKVTGVKEIRVTGVSAGTVTITITIPGGTKADYGERIIVIPYEVSDVQNKVAAPTFSPAAGAVAAGTEVTLATTTAEATIQYKLGDGEYQNYSDAIVVNGDVTITAKATKEGMTDSEEVEAAYTIATTPVEKADRNLAFSAETASVFVGATNQYPTLSGEKAGVTYSLENVSPEGCIAINAETGAITINAAGTATVKASAAETAEYKAGEVSYALTAVTPTFSVSPASFEVAADAKTVTVNITSNQAWQVQCTSPVEANPASGEGDGSVTFTFPENTEASAKLYEPIIAPVSAGDPVTVEINVEAKGYDFTNIAELKALEFAEATEYAGTLTGAVVSFVPSTSDAVIKDNTGSILLHKSSHGLQQGKTIDGEVTVKTGQYQGANQITALDATVSGSETAVAPETVTLAAIAANFSLYENAYVSVASLKVTAVDGKNVTVSDGTNTYIVFSNPANATCNVGDVLTAVGTVTKHNTTEEIKVWAADDLTVTQNGTGTVVTSKTYTITWNSKNNSKSVGSYTEEWSVTAEGLTCNMVNWNNNNNDWEYVKAGRKSNTSVATIITSAAIPESIKTVTLTIDDLTASKINSIKLYVSDSSTFGNTEVGSFDKSTGDQSVTISSPGANKFYKIEVDCASGSSNGLITVSKLVFTTE